MPGKGILAMDESNATCGSRLEGVGVENIEENRRRYRELLITTPNLGDHIGGAILFEETLYQSCSDGTSFVDALNAQGIYPGIKVDKVSQRRRNGRGLVPGGDLSPLEPRRETAATAARSCVFFFFVIFLSSSRSPRLILPARLS